MISSKEKPNWPAGIVHKGGLIQTSLLDIRYVGDFSLLWETGLLACYGQGGLFQAVPPCIRYVGDLSLGGIWPCGLRWIRCVHDVGYV